MFNHHRGLWGYTGTARADGEPLTIQATGMGGPSAAIVLHELIALGARRAIRVGHLRGARTRARARRARDRARRRSAPTATSRALGAGERVAADPGAHRRRWASRAAAHAGGAVVSVDLFYDDSARGRRHGASRRARDRDGGGDAVRGRRASRRTRRLRARRVRHVRRRRYAHAHRRSRPARGRRTDGRRGRRGARYVHRLRPDGRAASHRLPSAWRARLRLARSATPPRPRTAARGRNRRSPQAPLRSLRRRRRCSPRRANGTRQCRRRRRARRRRGPR